MIFTILTGSGHAPLNSNEKVFLTWDNWNDFSFHTLFGIFYVDSKGEIQDLGNIKM